MTIEAVLFDLDDTLIDWWGSITRCLLGFADDLDVRAAHDFVRANFWEVHPDSDFVWHRNTWALYERRHELWPSVFAHRHPDDRALLLRRFEEDLWVGFFPDVVPVLDHLVDRVRLAVLTNNQYIEREITRLRLHDWFEFALYPADTPKPDRRAFLTACDRLGVAPERVAHVGDSVRSDVLGAREAGLTPVWIDRWSDRWTERPDDVVRIDTLAELPALVSRGVS